MNRFISAGTDDVAPTERDEAWRKAQLELEAKKVQKAEAAQQGQSQSLYETLQANKAAKQEAFEESIRLRNQFRSLDEDEVEFLDSMLESTRAREAEVRRENAEQLETFRRQREAAEKAAAAAEGSPEVVEVSESWTAGPRKRKKGKEGLVGGVKVRRTSTNEKLDASAAARKSSAEVSTPPKPAAESSKDETPGAAPVKPAAPSVLESKAGEVAKATKPSSPSTASPSPPPAGGLGLAAYSSDEDD